MLKEKYKYKEFKRVEIDGKRYYETPEGKLPSITRILAETKPAKDKQALNSWRLRVGEDEANRISNESLAVGTLAHEILEAHLLGNEFEMGSTPLYQNAGVVADAIKENGLKNVSEVWGCEIPLHYKDQYSGTTDAIGLHNDIPAIIDFKNARKPKKREYIDAYFKQGAAYAMAHNEMYGSDIRRAVIMVGVWSGGYQEFILDGEDFEKYWLMWQIDLTTFNQKFK